MPAGITNAIILSPGSKGLEGQEFMRLALFDENGDSYNLAGGIQGPAGPQGPPGPVGPAGAQGTQGVQGATGSAGPKGDTGAPGAQGPVGQQGLKGDTGVAGPKGDTGSPGPQGLKGDKGDTGATGLTGGAGPQGAKGDIGLTGPKGDKGDTGSVGPQGPKGDTGDQGAQGFVGPQGPAGAGVPVGGTTNQVLAKASAADRDTHWVDPASGGGGSTPPMVAALPSSPTEGQEVYFQNALMEAQGIVWHLRYRGKNADNSNNASAFKWEVLGSPPAIWVEDPNVTTTNSAANIDPTTPVQANLPLAGDYFVEHGFSGSHSLANGILYQAITIGGTNTAVDDIQSQEANANALVTRHRKLKKTNLAAAAVAKIQHRVGAGGVGTYYRRYLAIEPIRLG